MLDTFKEVFEGFMVLCINDGYHFYVCRTLSCLLVVSALFLVVKQSLQNSHSVIVDYRIILGTYD